MHENGPAPTEKKLCGFAYMKKHDPERFREISSRGGKIGFPHQRSFASDRNLASEAGKKGRLARDRARKPSD